MLQDVITALRTVLDRLGVLAGEDAELRAELRGLAKAFIALAEEPPSAVPDPFAALVPGPSPDQEQQGSADSIELKDREPGTDGRQPTTDSRQPATEPSAAELAERLFPVVPAARTIEAPAWHAPSITDADLPILEARCRLKAEGARWAATRRRRLEEGADYYGEIEPRDRDLIGRANALKPECFLWMCQRHGPMPGDRSLYDDLAGCFDAAAYAAAILASAVDGPGTPELFEQALFLGAEAQSAVRGAVAAIGGNPDGDQLKLFIFVRETAAARSVWISRYMRQDDPADATGWSDLLERLHVLEQQLEHLKGRDKKHRKLVSKIRYHVKRAQDSAGTDPSSDWQTIIQSVEALVQDGVPPSNIELRNLLLPALDELPEALELPKDFQLVLREIDRFLAVNPVQREAPVEAEPSPEVCRAAELLAGRAVVLIGGDKRPPAAEALATALRLKELFWVVGRDQTYTAFEPYVADPDVALVILAIRWSRHGFSEVKEFCDKYHKPLVRLPGGYNPNQVAYHILAQVGNRLAEKVIA